jgi:N-glycosylase/DNA lyase
MTVRSESDQTRIRIQLDRPLDLPATLDGGQAFRWTRESDGWWAAPLGRTIIRLRQSSSHGDELELLPSRSEGSLSTGEIEEYLGLGDQIAAPLAALERNGIPAAELGPASGLRILRQDPWESLVSFILSQNSNVARIRKNVEDLSFAAGEPIVEDGRAIHAFPAPLALADLGEARLRSLKIGYRAPHLISVARAIAGGAVKLAELRNEPYDTARGTLMSLPGVGPKVADCVLAYALGFGESFPVDTWVEKAVRRWWPQVGSKNREQIAEWGRDRFGQDAAYAQLILFHLERRRVDASPPTGY